MSKTRLVQFSSYSRLTERRHDTDWFEWCVFVSDAPEVIQAIETVEYTLHPTFPHPVRNRQNSNERFALLSAGWGGFPIAITVTWRDGATTQHRYLLQMENDHWPRPDKEPELEGADAQVYDAIRQGETPWRKEVTIARRVGLTREALRDSLGRLASAHHIREKFVKSIEGERLWGATMLVGLLPTLERSA